MVPPQGLLLSTEQTSCMVNFEARSHVIDNADSTDLAIYGLKKHAEDEGAFTSFNSTTKFWELQTWGLGYYRIKRNATRMFIRHAYKIKEDYYQLQANTNATFSVSGHATYFGDYGFTRYDYSLTPDELTTKYMQLLGNWRVQNIWIKPDTEHSIVTPRNGTVKWTKKLYFVFDAFKIGQITNDVELIFYTGYQEEKTDNTGYQMIINEENPITIEFMVTVALVGTVIKERFEYSPSDFPCYMTLVKDTDSESEFVIV